MTTLQTILSHAETAAAGARGAARYDLLNIAEICRQELAKASRNVGGSILPSSAPHILTPLPFKHGALIVRVLEGADTHGLFWERDGGRKGEVLSSLLAAHPNGFSCRALAERMTKGDAERVREQAEYILRCGGTCIRIGDLMELLSMPSP